MPLITVPPAVFNFAYDSDITPSAHAQSIAPPPSPAGPDLVIDSLTTVPDPLAVNGPAVIYFRVKNIGNEIAGQFQISITQNSNNAVSDCFWNLAGLGPNQSYETNSSLKDVQCSRGQFGVSSVAPLGFSVSVTADNLQQIAEINENNNSFFNLFQPSGTAVPNPPPATTPPPPPPPLPPPSTTPFPESTKFIVGNRIETTANVNVRSFPYLSGEILGTEPTGSQGTVTGGVIWSDGFWWWQIQYDDGTVGWSVETYMEPAPGTAPAPQPLLPPPSAIPSTKFSINDRVITTTNLNVRATAGGTFLGTEPFFSFGTVIGGPVFADNSWWWQIQYDNGITGWSSEVYFEKLLTPTPIPSPTPTPAPTSAPFEGGETPTSPPTTPTTPTETTPTTEAPTPSPEAPAPTTEAPTPSPEAPAPTTDTTAPTETGNIQSAISAALSGKSDGTAMGNAGQMAGTIGGITGAAGSIAGLGTGIPGLGTITGVIGGLIGFTIGMLCSSCAKAFNNFVDGVKNTLNNIDQTICGGCIGKILSIVNQINPINLIAKAINFVCGGCLDPTEATPANPTDVNAAQAAEAANIAEAAAAAAATAEAAANNATNAEDVGNAANAAAVAANVADDAAAAAGVAAANAAAAANDNPNSEALGTAAINTGIDAAAAEAAAAAAAVSAANAAAAANDAASGPGQAQGPTPTDTTDASSPESSTETAGADTGSSGPGAADVDGGSW